jgi:D-alanyl-lipoteichoic acid acyltransferase DltB (MBOAT superfamily)
MLILICTIVDWNIAKKIYITRKKTTKKICVLLSVIVNLSMLSYYKYANFFFENISIVLNTANIQIDKPEINILLPIGISFFTFQSLSYVIDVYRNNMKPSESITEYALYISFFPKLINGPITRANGFLDQINKEKKINHQQFFYGLTLLLIGLFEKVVIADGLLAPVADKVFDAYGRQGFIESWTGAIAFTGQIFCDFAGYSSCAIGTALLFGIKLPKNFQFPYAAIGFSDFWKRWHISLSEWLRDYLYISLGGNRKGNIRTYINLMITMILGGLWHGASWTFIIWGALHGCYLILERIIKKIEFIKIKDNNLTFKIMLTLFTYIIVAITWVFFRSSSIEKANEIIKTMLWIDNGTLSLNIDNPTVMMVFGINAIILFIHYYMRNKSLEIVANNTHWALKAAVLTFMMVSIITASGEDRAFIYFQF